MFILVRIIFISLFVVFSVHLFAQEKEKKDDDGCFDFLKHRTADVAEGFVKSTQSKSGKCFSGKTYIFMLPIESKKIYRVSFYASAAFDRNVHFKIIDKATGRVVLDANGDSDPNDPNKYGALAEMEVEGNFVHAYYDFTPWSSATTLQIIIEVGKADAGRILEGCIGIFVQDKPFVKSAFEEIIKN